MTQYTTETGYYVLVDSKGRVFAKANVSVATHPVDERTDPSKSHDVGSQDDLDAVEIDAHYAES